jgi:hypothetical protein
VFQGVHTEHDFFEYYRLAAYIAARTTERIGIVMGVPSLLELFDEKYYTQLPGGILESFGRLFKNDLRLSVYPLRRTRTRSSRPTTTSRSTRRCARSTSISPCVAASSPWTTTAMSAFPIFSRDVLREIVCGDSTWESMVRTPWPTHEGQVLLRLCAAEGRGVTGSPSVSVCTAALAN